MALARTTSSSAVRRGTLPISLRYMRTGSSMPRRLPRSRTAATRCVSAGSWAMRVLLGDRCGGAAGGLGKQGFIVEPTVELGTLALQLEHLAQDPVADDGVAGGFGLGQLGALEVEQVDEAAAFEVEQALLERLLQDRLRLGLGIGPGVDRPGEGAQGRVERLEEAIARELALRIAVAVGEDGPPQLAGGRRDEVLGWQPVAHAELPGGVGQEEPKQRGLDRLQGAGDRLGVESAWAGEDGIEVDPTASVGPLGPAGTAGPETRGLAQLLEQDALLDARAAGQELEVAVAPDRGDDGAQRGHDRGHEALAALDRLRVVARGVDVDEVLHDRLRPLGGGAPGGGVLADHFVGGLALGGPHDAKVREGAAVGGALDLADERRQLG